MLNISSSIFAHSKAFLLTRVNQWLLKIKTPLIAIHSYFRWTMEISSPEWFHRSSLEYAPSLLPAGVDWQVIQWWRYILRLLRLLTPFRSNKTTAKNTNQLPLHLLQLNYEYTFLCKFHKSVDLVILILYSTT